MEAQCTRVELSERVERPVRIDKALNNTYGSHQFSPRRTQISPDIASPGPNSFEGKNHLYLQILKSRWMEIRELQKDLFRTVVNEMNMK